MAMFMSIDYSQRFYEFECFCVDVQRSLLMREGVPIKLTPKIFETLLGLVRSGGRVMGKAELMDQIWPDSFVEESNLAQNIFLLRRLFGEHKHENRFIITVPGVGYRFAPRVSSPRQGDAKKGEPVQAIAVMPFRSLHDDRDGLLGLGIADALITRLSRVKSIKVLPTQSVMSLGENGTPQSLRNRHLGVDAILNGVYQRDGEEIRVSAQLKGVEDGTTLWAEKFDRKFTSLFAVQDAVSEEITQALVLKLNGQERRHLSMVSNDGKSGVRRCS